MSTRPPTPMPATTGSAVVVVETTAPPLDALLRLSELLAHRFTSSEIVLVANDAPPEVSEALARMIDTVPDLTVHFLIGRVDFHAARLVGIDNALGDWVLLTSAAVDEMAHLEALLDRIGTADVIIVESGAHPERSGLYQLGERGFLWLCHALTRIQVESSRPLRLLSRAACMRIVNDPHGELLVRASQVGSGIRVVRMPGRYAARTGRRRYALVEGLSQGISALVQSSVVPLRLVSVMSAALALFAVLYVGYVIAVYLLKADVAPGWTTMSLQLSILTLSTALMLWLIAEYVLVVRTALPPRRRILIGRELRSPLTRHGDRLNVVDEEGRLLAVGGPGQPAPAGPTATFGHRSPRTALIGHTGFVGSNLDRVDRFTDRFNSKNSAELSGSFDVVVCAGVSAAKWIANRDPEADWAAIEKLIATLERVKAEEFVLISTIDVYPDPAAGGDESAIIDGAANHAYGRNRLRLEDWVTQRFPVARVVRLPALYGPGLKKNALYDLMHDNQVAQINPAGRFQWYPVQRTWEDLGRMRAADLRLANLVTEPLPMSEIIGRYFPHAAVGPDRQPAPTYCLRTRHAAALGSQGAYLMSAAEVLEDIGCWVAAEDLRPQ